MSTTVIERPAQYSFSKNEIRYKFLTDNLSPLKQFVQVELYARLFKTNSFLNWSILQKDTPFVDANIYIDVNGTRIVSETDPGSGTINLSTGDTVVITMPVFTSWPAHLTGRYAKLVVMQESTELFNMVTEDDTAPGWLTYTFTVLANTTYTVLGYTETEGDFAEASTKDLPVINSFALLKTFNLKPNSDGSTYLYIDGYIDSLLVWVVPSLATVYTNASEQSCQFYIRFREVSVDAPDPAWIETEAEKIRIALKGGIEKQKSSRNNYFLYQDSNKTFFTWIPSQRFIFMDQPAWISALIKVQGEYKLRISIKLSNGDTVTQENDLHFLDGIFYHINVSYNGLGIEALAAGEQVHYYEISILNEALDTTLFNVYRFYIEYRPLYDFFDIIYHCSLGGIDTARIRGEVAIGFEKEVHELGGGMSNTGWSDVVKTGESSQLTTNRKTYKGDIGYLQSKAHQEALLDLIISPSIYQFVDSRFVPVLNMQRTVNFRKTSDKIYSLPLEWTLPFSNEVFTPGSIELGLGTETETY